MSARKVKSKANSKKTLLTLGIVLIVLIAIGGAAYGPIHRRYQAQHDVDVLLLAINGAHGYLEDYGEYPKGSFATICKLLRGESIDGQNPKHLDYIEGEKQEFNKDGEILDPWGTPYHISFEGAIKIYSSGPNKRDENGQGDDIVAKPNPSLVSN